MAKRSDAPKGLEAVDFIGFAILACAIVLAGLAVAAILAGCATHTQPDTRMWDEARDMIRDGSFTDSPEPMPQWVNQDYVRWVD